MEKNKRAVAEEFEIRAWYDEHYPIYSAYAKDISTLLEELIKKQEISYHAVTYRTKEKESLVKKYWEKGYPTPKAITDTAGVRVIAYTMDDVKRICKLIKKEFVLDRKNSVDKAAKMGKDQVGYLSVHFIVSLTPEQIQKLKQEQPQEQLYDRYAGLWCEIQVRTLLQHTWAEIEHDRSYKFDGEELPPRLKRRFYLVAGVLEMMDQEFQRLSNEVRKYANTVNKRLESDSYLECPINTVTLSEYTGRRFPQLEDRISLSKTIVQELNDMGVQTLKQLEDLLPDERANLIIEGMPTVSNVFLLRTAMILWDTHKYFDDAWRPGSYLFASSGYLDFLKKNGADVDYVARKIRVAREAE